MSSHQRCEARVPALPRAPPHGRLHPSRHPAPRLKPGLSTARPPASGPPREPATPPSLTAAALTATAFVHLEATPRQPASPEPAGVTRLKAGTRRSGRGENRRAPQRARPGSRPGLHGGPGGASLLRRRHVTQTTPLCRYGRGLDTERSRPPDSARPCSSCCSSFLAQRLGSWSAAPSLEPRVCPSRASWRGSRVYRDHEDGPLYKTRWLRVATRKCME